MGSQDLKPREDWKFIVDLSRSVTITLALLNGGAAIAFISLISTGHYTVKQLGIPLSEFGMGAGSAAVGLVMLILVSMMKERYDKTLFKGLWEYVTEVFVMGAAAAPPSLAVYHFSQGIIKAGEAFFQ